MLMAKKKILEQNSKRFMSSVANFLLYIIVLFKVEIAGSEIDSKMMESYCWI